jgi:hypothetical protein
VEVMAEREDVIVDATRADSPIAAVVKSTATGWRKEAERRRAISGADPVADTLEYCAGEIAARLADVRDDEYETVEQRAKREGVTPQTVRIWIRANQLAAEGTAKGYRIRRDARRVRRSA